MEDNYRIDQGTSRIEGEVLTVEFHLHSLPEDTIRGDLTVRLPYSSPQRESNVKDALALLELKKHLEGLLRKISKILPVD